MRTLTGTPAPLAREQALSHASVNDGATGMSGVLPAAARKATCAAAPAVVEALPFPSLSASGVMISRKENTECLHGGRLEGHAYPVMRGGNIT